MARWFVRCSDCLAVGALDSDARNTRNVLLEPAPGTCPCGGRTEVLGRVKRARLARDADECPCDGRCTAARGPLCDCSCAGRNHGSGMLISVERDAGAQPRYMLRPDVARAEAYRAARTAALARVESMDTTSAQARRAAGEYVGAADFAVLRAQGLLREAVRAACRLRSHGGRVAALGRIAL